MTLEFHWGMLVAAAAGFAIGAVWYRIFGAPWMRAVDMARDRATARVQPYAVAVAANLLIAFIFGNIMRMFEISGPVFGLIFGSLLWLGFTIPVLALNYAFAGRPTSLTVIDGGHALLNICLQGVVLAWINVASSGY